jgi:hypothetical protein
MVRLDRKKRAELPEYKRKLDSVEISQEEASKEADKILYANTNSDEDAYELEYMGKFVYTQLHALMNT